MGAQIIDGKAVAASLRRDVAARVAQLTSSHGIQPGLAVVLVGNDPASEVYVGSKARSTVETGMRSFEHRLSGEIAQAELLALIVGRSNIVGKPMVQLLLGEQCTVTIAHSRTRDLPGRCRQADVLVAAVGRPQMIRGDWIKPGAIVIDVGINRLPPDANGKSRLVGDVAFDEARQLAGAITPVPGGVGPMTIACLLKNTVQAAQARRGMSVA